MDLNDVDVEEWYNRFFIGQFCKSARSQHKTNKTYQFIESRTSNWGLWPLRKI